MKQLFFVLSAIGTIYTVTSMLENMRNAGQAKRREEEMLSLLRRIDAKLAERGRA